MHNIVSMYLMYRVSCIIIASVSKCCVSSFTLLGLLVDPHPCAAIYNLRSNKGGKCRSKMCWKEVGKIAKIIEVEFD
jgi:hypothetical protein